MSLQTELHSERHNAHRKSRNKYSDRDGYQITEAPTSVCVIVRLSALLPSGVHSTPKTVGVLGPTQQI